MIVLATASLEFRLVTRVQISESRRSAKLWLSETEFYFLTDKVLVRDAHQLMAQNRLLIHPIPGRLVRVDATPLGQLVRLETKPPSQELYTPPGGMWRVTAAP